MQRKLKQYLFKNSCPKIYEISDNESLEKAEVVYMRINESPTRKTLENISVCEQFIFNLEIGKYYLIKFPHFGSKPYIGQCF